MVGRKAATQRYRAVDHGGSRGRHVCWERYVSIHQFVLPGIEDQCHCGDTILRGCVPLVLSDHVSHVVTSTASVPRNRYNPQNTPITFEFVTAMLKGQPCEMTLKGGNAQEGTLRTLYDGSRPSAHGSRVPMRKEGAVIMGTGGDNSHWGEGGLTSCSDPTMAASSE